MWHILIYQKHIKFKKKTSNFLQAMKHFQLCLAPMETGDTSPRDFSIMTLVKGKFDAQVYAVTFCTNGQKFKSILECFEFCLLFIRNYQLKIRLIAIISSGPLTIWANWQLHLCLCSTCTIKCQSFVVSTQINITTFIRVTQSKTIPPWTVKFRLPLKQSLTKAF